jgi:erythromycin esterase-like protein
MFHGHVSSWNLRDQHMVETLDALDAHLGARHGRPAKIVVWAHNSHLGDARATELGRHGELNVGQLVRERHGDSALLVGFTTYAGTVTAASDWDEPAERKTVRPAVRGSYESAFHAAGIGNFALDLRRSTDLGGLATGPPDPPDARSAHAAPGRSSKYSDAFLAPRLERAIGVVYRPETERHSHYFEAVLARQFDVVLHYDHTRAVEPLERTALWERGEVPETYPSAL